jgi:hypothetical protein
MSDRLPEARRRTEGAGGRGVLPRVGQGDGQEIHDHGDPEGVPDVLLGVEGGPRVPYGVVRSPDEEAMRASWCSA